MLQIMYSMFKEQCSLMIRDDTYCSLAENIECLENNQILSNHQNLFGDVISVLKANSE